MASYRAESEPLIGEISNDNSQIQELLHLLGQNGLGNQNLVSVNALKDALRKSIPETALNKKRHGSIQLNSFGFSTQKCNKPCCIVIPEFLQNYKTYLAASAFTLVWIVGGFIFLLTRPKTGIIVALSIEITLTAIFLLLASYWWGRRGPPITLEGDQYLEVPRTETANNAQMDAEYYA